MKVIVAIPWRAQPSRVPLKDAVRDWYARNLTDATVIECDSGHAQFNRAATRNICVQAAADMGADVVVINDADTIPERWPLLEAIHEVRYDTVAHLPYDECRVINMDDSERYVRQRNDLRGYKGFTMYTSVGGVMVTTPAIWASHNGQDERFTGWGYEDSAWAIAHTTLLGPYARHPGVIFSLDHQHDDKSKTATQSGVQLILKYQDADGNPERMRELVFRGQ